MTARGFTYVVLCHRNSDQVLRLVRRVRKLSPAAGIVVRHDRGPGFLDEVAVAAAGGQRSIVLDDAANPVTWGDWSMVEATERALAVARSAFDPDWVVLLSGQDWPVRDLAAWEADLASSGVDAVMRAERVELTLSSGRRLTAGDLTRARWTHRWHTLPSVSVVEKVPASLRAKVSGRFAASLQWYLRPVMLRQLPRGLGWKVGVRRRRLGLPEGWHVVKGEQWWALGRPALDAVQRTAVEMPSVRHFFTGTHIPDESYLQTVVANTPGLRVQDGRVSWHRFDGPSPSPAVLSVGDVPAAVASGAPFARKVDVALEPAVVSLLDAAVGVGADRAAAHTVIRTSAR